MADEDLSDEQLQQLLKDAESRLRSKSKGKSQALAALDQRYFATIIVNPRYGLTSSCRIPQIDSGSAIQSYINKTKQGAQIDKSLLVQPEVRQLASVVRTVEDPVAVRANVEKVCRALHAFKSFYMFFNDEDNPKFYVT